MNDEQFLKVPQGDQQHFLRCWQCGEWFDVRNLDEAIFHCLGHVPRPDFNYSGVIKAQRCNDCGIGMKYFEKRRKKFVGYWKCDDCGRIDWTTSPPKIYTAEEIYFS